MQNKMDSLIDIDIVEVKSPSDFTARISLPSEQEAYRQAFHQLQNDMKVIEQSTVSNHEVHTNDLCVVKDRTDRQWQRVRVEKVQSSGRGQEASCHFVDLGRRERLLVHRLYKLPKRYQKERVPYQVRTLKLWGLKPMSMKIELTDTGMQTPNRPAEKWDESARNCFRAMTKECKQAKVLVKESKESEDVPVILYLLKDGQLVNINDILIGEEYACAVYSNDRDVSTSTFPVTGNKTSCRDRQHPHHQHSCLDPQSLATHHLRGGGENGEEALTEQGLKHILSKVQCFSTHQQCESDSKVINKSLEKGSTRGKKPAFGSRPTSRMDNVVCGNEGVREVVNKSAGCAGSVTSSLSSRVCQEVGPGRERVLDLVGAASGFQTIPVHSSSDSDSSSYTELKSYNLSKEGSGLKSKLKMNGTSPELLAHAAEVAPSSHSTISLGSTGHITMAPTSKGAVAKSRVSSNVGSLSLTTPASGVKPSSEKVVIAGRGRGMRKLHSKDVARLAQYVHASCSPPDRMKMEDTNRVDKGQGAGKTSASHIVSQHVGTNSATVTTGLLPEKNPSRLVHESHTKLIETGHDISVKESTVLPSSCSDLCLGSGTESRGCELGAVAKDMASSPPSHSLGIYNPREIDLNEECAETKSQRIYNPREIDLNDEYTKSPLTDQSSSQTFTDRLISLLGGVSKDSSEENRQVKVPLVWRPDRAMPRPLLGTIPCGMCLPSPVFDVEEILLNDVVKSYMLKEEFNIPRAIQAHTWPAVIRGRNIIGITPRHSGKTTAYLPPLVSELLKFSKYQKLPRGMGPRAVILVASCKKADDILHYVNSMVYKKTTFKVLSIYGSEDHQVIPLLRGCDLLISTPHCLLRMLRSRYTHLNRLCHLVLDGAQVLVKEFAKETNEVMQLYAEELRKYRRLPVPRQVMAFGTRWSPAMAAFQKAYQPDPVLVFSSRLEASIYGNIEQVVHMCFHTRHLTTMRDVMDKLMEDPDRHRIVIATSNEENLELVDQLLKSMSLYAHVVDVDASFDDIEDRVARWMEQSDRAILVVTDNNVTELRLTSADTVVHFDIPNSQTKFGNRLALMLEYFQDRFVEPVPQKKKGVSHLLLTNQMLDHVQSLHSFLQRSRATIPLSMTRLLEGMRLGRNGDETRALCLQLKQFGQCQNEVKCESRHLILPCDVIQDGSPEDWLPVSGVIKVRVLNTINTSHYYVMLLEHQVPGEPRKDLQSLHTSLTMDLAMYLSVDKNQVPFIMQEGEEVLAAVKDVDGLFHRARVLSIQKSSVKTGSQQLEVLYVDEGRKAIVRPDQLLKLPPKLQDIPPLAVEVFICRVKPVDGDTEWTRSSKDYVMSQLKGKDLIGNVILRMKNTLWLDPLAEQKKLKHVNTSIISMIVRPDLLKRGFADDNPDHVKNLYKACDGTIPIDKKLYKKYLNLQHRKEIETETLLSEQEFHDVYITVVEDPNLFFIQKKYNREKLEKHDQEVQKYMIRRLYGKEGETQPQASAKTSASSQAIPTQNSDTVASTSKTESSKATEEKPATQPSSGHRSSVGAALNATETEGKREDMLEQGCFCLAKFSQDEKWYRAQILEKLEGEWLVFFVDHGDQAVVADSDLYPIPDQFCKLPAQAMECGLSFVRPTGEEWSDSSGDLLWNLAVTVNKGKKWLFAKVSSTERAEVAGATKYMVEVYDTCSWNRDMHFGQELVWAHEATADEEKVKSLFPKVTFNIRKMYPNVDARMCDMCAALYWSEDEKNIEVLTKQLSGVIGRMILSEDKTQGQKGLKEAVKLIGYLRSPDSQSAILSVFVQCIKKNTQMCGSVIGTALVVHLVFCMEQARHPAVQLQAASTAVELMKIEGFTPYLADEKIVAVMRDYILTEDPSPEMLIHVCTFLAYMLTHANWSMEEMELEELVPVVFEIRAEIIEPDTQETLLALVAAMAPFKQFHSSIMREKHIQQILSIMAEAPSQRCVFRCAQICMALCETHRRNKRLLFEAGLVLVLKEVLEGGVQEPARQLCTDLVTSLAASVPQQQTLAGQQIFSHNAATSEGPVHLPPVKWSQNSFRVVLTVTVQGAKESDFSITESSVTFRCESGGKVYGFEYELYDVVDQSKCCIIVHPGEVVLSLAKVEKGRWSRLLSSKKFFNLTVDFDKLVDSSDSELDDPENITLVSRSKKGLAGPPPSNKQTKYENVVVSDEAIDTSSDSDGAAVGSESEDERFGEPSHFVDPLSVMETVINFRAQERPEDAWG